MNYRNVLKRLLKWMIPAVVGALITPLFLQGLIEKAILSWGSTVFLALIFFCLLVLAAMVSLAMLDIAELLQSVGIKIRYVERDTDETVGREPIFREVKEVVKRAKHEILVVNSCVFDRNEESQEVESCEEQYYSTLISHVVATSDLVYKRILQLKKDQVVNDLKQYSIDDGLPQHLHDMLKAKEDKRTRGKISLRQVDAQRFTTFLLIDDKYLIWQINAFRESSQKLELHGVFIIEDPHMQITQHFKNFCWLLGNHDSEKPVQVSELPPVSGSEAGGQLTSSGKVH